MDSLDEWLTFRAGENPRPIVLKCTECSGRAEGNVSWADGSGEICDTCHALDQGGDPTG